MAYTSLTYYHNIVKFIIVLTLDHGFFSQTNHKKSKNKKFSKNSFFFSSRENLRHETFKLFAMNLMDRELA